jgi:polyhydroxyalkanoic acid synthase PhaR subunit
MSETKDTREMRESKETREKRERKRFDPMDFWKKVYDDAEKRWNEGMELFLNNRSFVRLSRMGINMQAVFLETLRRNQERWLNEMNLPTRKDLARVSKIAIQTETKVDTLEEQVWDLADAQKAMQEELQDVVAASRELVQINKQLKQELSRLKTQLAEAQESRGQLEELKEQIVGLKLAVNQMIADQEAARGNVKQGDAGSGDLIASGTNKK